MQLKCLKKKLKEAEKRAITAERTVKALLKEVDMKEGERGTFLFVFSLEIIVRAECENINAEHEIWH